MATCTESANSVVARNEEIKMDLKTDGEVSIMEGSSKPAVIKTQRQKSLKSPILSPQDIAKEILERSQRKHPPRLPEGGDVIFTMKLTQRLAKRVVGGETGGKPPDLDARKLLSILQDGAESHYLDKPKTPSKPGKSREAKLDPELEKRLALKQLMEFSKKRGRQKKENNNNNNNNNNTNEPKKRKTENRELENLLQDEGAINMLYAIEKGEPGKDEGLLPSKRRMKKALVRKAQEVKEALLGGGSGGLNLRQRGSPPARKPSVDSIGSDRSGPEASRIIRRHSSSSSCDSPPLSPHNGLKERIQSNLALKLHLQQPQPLRRSSDTWRMLQEDWTDEDPPQIGYSESCKTPNSEKGTTNMKWRRELVCHLYRELKVRRVESLIHVDVAPVSTRLPNALNAQVLKELGTVLEEVGKDNTCTVLLLTCGGGRFQGIDLPGLLHNDLETRRSSAQQLAEALKDFVCKLCMVKKGVVCGVSGEAVGLGAVMLAYMDLVIAGSEATFHTPYSVLGHAPEAAATLVLPKTVGLSWSRRLLVEGRKLSAGEALDSGLVSTVVPHDSFHTHLLNSALSLSKLSPQSIESSKAMLLHDVRSRLGWVLGLESSILVQHWSSDECQNRIRAYLAPPPPP